MSEHYLQWLARETPTSWWHDSGDPVELDRGLALGATGVTTNPVLTGQALRSQVDKWRPQVEALGDKLNGADRVELLMNLVVCDAAHKLEGEFTKADGRAGHVCAQVNPAKAADRDAMLAMARRFHAWAPNIAVKLPATAAGLDVLEECAAEGITVTATVSFTVPQVIAVAERHRTGQARARKAGITPGHCFSVIMIGRQDDYIRDIAHDQKAKVLEDDIRLAGLAVSKRAYQMYKDANYDAVLLIAALRGVHHMTELAGADLIMSIHPKVQVQLEDPSLPREQRYDRPVDSAAIKRLLTMPEFVKAYEPDGMAPEEFMSYGLAQRTLTQFAESGWGLIEAFKL